MNYLFDVCECRQFYHFLLMTLFLFYDDDICFSPGGGDRDLNTRPRITPGSCTDILHLDPIAFDCDRHPAYLVITPLIRTTGSRHFRSRLIKNLIVQSRSLNTLHP